MPRQKEILFVSHDANRAGAQIFLYNIMDYLQNNGFKVVLLLVNDWGSFREEMESNFVTYSLQNPPKSVLDKFLKGSLNTLDIIKSRHDIDLIYVNTIASVHLLESLKTTFGAPVLTHIHELSYSIKQFGVPGAPELLFKFSDTVIACSEAVAENLEQYGSRNQIEVIHSFVNNQDLIKIQETEDRTQRLSSFGLDTNFKWVGACGNADWRKAPDMFVQIAAKSHRKDLRFAWIGIKEQDELKSQLVYDAEKLGIKDKIAWIEPTPLAKELINAMDYFLLCSREDPFPLVMLEAALCKKPIFTFKNTGGGDEFVEENAGRRIDYLDAMAMAQALDSITEAESQDFGLTAQTKVLENYSFEQSIQKIENLIERFL